MNDTETKNTAVKAPALMSTRPVTAQDALDQCEKLSPMMVHYCQTKTGLTDPANTILFYRLGDFYEMFFEDATLVSKELELTLTGEKGRRSGQYRAGRCRCRRECARAGAD